jgi:hypothetical protein
VVTVHRDLERYCDRCERHALAWWALIPDDPDDDTGAELRLCAPHSAAHAETLVVRGWVLVAETEDVSVG